VSGPIEEAHGTISDLNDLRDRYRRSLEAFIRGDPEPQKRLWSHREDTTLANPLGPPVKGHDRVCEVADNAAALVRDGEGLALETISFVETPDLAYEVDIQRGTMKLGDSDELVPVALRVTTIFRREDEGWRIVHRHADPLTERPVQALKEHSS
jgi:ketosteroid isomerase-like protein